MREVFGRAWPIGHAQPDSRVSGKNRPYSGVESNNKTTNNASEQRAVGQHTLSPPWGQVWRYPKTGSRAVTVLEKTFERSCKYAPPSDSTDFREAATTVSCKNHGLFCSRGRTSCDLIGKRFSDTLESTNGNCFQHFLEVAIMAHARTLT